MAERKFKTGDVVKSSHGIGFVGWIENKAMGIEEKDCLLGIDLQTNSCGFVSPVKEEACEKSSLKDIICYYKDKARNSDIKAQEFFNKLKSYEATLSENKLLKELLKIYFEQSKEDK